jgi:PHD/YefM family antitoxin component YafN of YafNO toxin-antitoxin module
MPHSEPPRRRSNKMSTTMSIAEAREKLTTLPAHFEQDPASEVVMVTRHNKPVLAIMPWDLYDTLIETLEVMGDPGLMAQLRQSISEATAGETISWAEAKSRLGRQDEREA